MSADQIDHWSYRAVRFTEGDETTVSMVEAYFNAAGEILGWCPASVEAVEDESALADSLRRMQEAIRDHGVLDGSSLPGSG